jgi:hypothetical protein
MIKVGDEVIWRGSWGRDTPAPARIVSMELCESRREKYGITVTEAYEVDKDRLVVTLDNGHWAYGEQLELLKQKEEV